jgi:membrane protease YdiL (CAAX protease family)
MSDRETPKQSDQGRSLLRGAVIVLMFLAIIGTEEGRLLHAPFVWLSTVTKGFISHDTLQAGFYSLVQAMIICLCTVTVVWLFRGGLAAALADLGLRRGIVRGLAVGAVATLPLPIIYAIWWRATFNAEVAVQVGVYGVIAAIGEELLFRGFAFGLLYRKVRLSFWLSIILPTAAFAAGHLYQVHGFRDSLAVTALTGIGSIWFGWLYVRWDYNLWVPIALHALMNSWWSVFNVSQTALAGHTANEARLLTIVLSVVLTLRHCGWDWRRALLNIRPEEPISNPIAGRTSSAHAAGR